MNEIYDTDSELFAAFIGYAQAAMAQKSAMSEMAGYAIDLPPILMNRNENGDYNCMSAVPVEGDESARDLIKRMLTRDDYDYGSAQHFALVVDSYTRTYDSRDEAQEFAKQSSGGSLAMEYKNNPLTDVIEGLSIIVFDLTGDFVQGFIQVILDDKGMPDYVNHMFGIGNHVVSRHPDTNLYQMIEDFIRFRNSTS